LVAGAAVWAAQRDASSAAAAIPIVSNTRFRLFITPFLL
jgi:hypothetical protein